MVAADAAIGPSSTVDGPLCTVEDLWEAVELCRGWPRVRTARWVIAHASTLSESPLESISRAVFYKHRVPQPLQQVWINDQIRVDFLWDAAKLVGEADGEMKYALDPAARRRQDEREATLRDLGYTVIRWGWDEALIEHEHLAARIRTALVDRRVPSHVGSSVDGWYSTKNSWFLAPACRLVG